eukprot:TsM_001176200 transcript=TsM_001176200 gene=TsM_001176200
MKWVDIDQDAKKEDYEPKRQTLQTLYSDAVTKKPIRKNEKLIERIGARSVSASFNSAKREVPKVQNVNI